MDRLKWPIPISVFAIVVILGLLLLRFTLMVMFPLYDTTEARYGEIARLMYETGNWITPHIDYHVPFWGKPPLHTWMSAISMMMFGISGFAARLPHFLCGLGILLLVYRFAHSVKNKETAQLSVLILTSSVGFFISIGMVMTDIALLFSTTLAMLSFWQLYLEKHEPFYGYIFFLALGLGMLIKGPVAVLLVMVSLITWGLWHRTIFTIIRILPWFSGLSIFILIAVPWYIAAEVKTEGFIEYFIFGEHFQRFLVSGWEGDLYGNGHNQPRGTIWLFWLVAALPWSIVLLVKGCVKIKQCGLKKHSEHHQLYTYLLSWIIAPMLIFTFAGNILIAYVLPGFSAMAILYSLNSRLNRTNIVLASVCFVSLCSLPMLKYFDMLGVTSEIELIGSVPAKYENSQLVYWQKKPYSAAFYSSGQARRVSEESELIALVNGNEAFYVAAKNADSEVVLPMLKDNCVHHNATKERFLVFCGKQHEDTFSRR